MGRNYQEEVSQLPATIDWARNFDLKAWLPKIEKLRSRNLVIVASGGSFSAAQLLAQLHTAQSGQLAVAMTPVDFITSELRSDAVVWFISASGSNQDILNAWAAATERETRDIVVLCGSPASPLATKASFAAIFAAISFEMPTGKDGFLATNSLIAFCCLLMRLYGEEVPSIDLDSLPTISALARERPSLIVLYSGWMKPAALDIESRFSEAALGSVMMSDYRNFAHGRHYWLSRHGASTAVLALTTPADNALATDTLAQLPPDVVVARWDFSSDTPQTTLMAILGSLVLAGALARDKLYDAGRPGVPEFGERIYNLGTKLSVAARGDPKSVAVERKLHAGTSRSPVHADLLKSAADDFINRLASTKLEAVAFDYDGTLVATERRFQPLEDSMALALNALLDDGLTVGIATGRGKSCHPHLRSAIHERHWGNVVIGYYNGGIIKGLGDDCDQVAKGEPCDELKAAEHALRGLWELEGAEFDLRSCQLTIAKPGFREHGLWTAVRGCLDEVGLTGLKVRHSSHSVDVLPASVSKRLVVACLMEQVGCDDDAVLKIGDRGRWPGNDSELLSMKSGLSVDEVSTDPTSCWNLLPRGSRGHHGTLWYLQRLIDRHLKL